MNTNPPCPVCGERRWVTIGERTYRWSDLGRLGDYERLRFEVLFEIWFPGSQEITLTSALCQNCGFVTYLPRPEEADIDAKYRYLTARDRAAGAPDPDSGIERMRARQLLGRFRASIEFGRATRVLDFGGGDGRLLRDIASCGSACFVVDYSRRVAPWVTHIGETQEDLRPDDRFDVITCVHVIEHVAKPVKVLESLAGHLAESGLIYVEVPMEIWGRAPLHEEPVTHVNFFTPLSLRRCLQEAGLSPVHCRLDSYWYPPKRSLLAVSALARKGDGMPSMPASSRATREALGFLHPGIRERVRRYAAAPETIGDALASKARRLLRT